MTETPKKDYGPRVLPPPKLHPTDRCLPPEGYAVRRALESSSYEFKGAKD